MNSAFVLCEELCRSRRICTILHILLSLKAKIFFGKLESSSAPPQNSGASQLKKGHNL